ncbi:hypothetical protein ACFVYA_22805 [Amycolatopsis sp. NPDC058278]|uniref:hypothetical protein n=1 Tax=Amycolatopsis sp. NPDC058278 TaxID=3346417 RepID=UPI0036DC7E66
MDRTREPDPRQVRIDHGQGVVVGDHARVEMHVHPAARPRTPQGPVRTILDIDPTELGIHRAIHLGPERDDARIGPAVLTPYIRRDHDETIVSALTGEHRSAKLVILVGGSSIGKTRACYEAIVRTNPDSSLIAPEDADELAALLENGVPSNTVLWLDDFQRYVNGLNGEAVAAGLRRQLAASSHRGDHLVVIGSMWPHWWLTLTRTPGARPRDAHSAARNLLALADKITVVEDFSGLTGPDEDHLLRKVSTDPRLRAAFEAGGPTKRIAQVLAGGPLVVDRFTTLVDEHAKAVLLAAVDATRMGFDSALPGALLEQAAAGYLTPELRVAAEGWFAAALAEATELAHGIRALTPVRSTAGIGSPDGYRLHDYLLQYATRVRRRERPPAQLWEALVAHAVSPDDASRVSESAQSRLLYRYALPLLRFTADSGDERSAQRLAILLAQQGDVEALQARADQGDSWAAHELVQVLAQARDFHRLKISADAGNSQAALWLTKLLAEWGDLDELKLRADAGDSQARKYYVDLLIKRGDLVKLRIEAGNGDRRAQDHLVRLWVSRGDVAELTKLARHGDSRAASGLVEVLARNEDITGLRARADVGDVEATARLVDLFGRKGDIAGLADYAAAGNDAASWEIARLLTDRGDFERLKDRAERGDVPARRYVISFLESWGNVAGLRHWAGTGDLDAVHALAGMLAKSGKSDEAIAVLVGALDAPHRPGAESLVCELERTAGFDPHSFEGFTRAEVGVLNAVHRILRSRTAAPELPPVSGPGVDRPDRRRDWVSPLSGKSARALVPTRTFLSAMITRGDLEGLRRLARAGNTLAAAGVLDVLADRGDVAGLREQADDGDGRASAVLAELLAERGDLAAIRERVDHGDVPALERLVRILVAEEDSGELRHLADAGHIQAAAGLANVLFHRADLEGLKREVTAGNLFASSRLMDLVARQHPRLFARLRRYGLTADGTPA